MLTSVYSTLLHHDELVGKRTCSVRVWRTPCSSFRFNFKGLYDKNQARPTRIGQGPHGGKEKLRNMFHEKGITLNQYYVQPSCSPSRATFMSGRMPLHTGSTIRTYSGYVRSCRGIAYVLGGVLMMRGINDWIPNKAYGLPLGETTLPQLLSAWAEILWIAHRRAEMGCLMIFLC